MTQTEQIEFLKKEHRILGKIPVNQVEKEKIGWSMIEHNSVYGLASFEYFYLNDLVCFQYDLEPYQPIPVLLKGHEADFEMLYFLCEEIFKILEKSSEYLLEEKNFLLKPEWIFADSFRKEVILCYMPGRDVKEKSELCTFFEFLMEHMDHKDRKAVAFIYKIYDFLMEDPVAPEEILEFIKQNPVNDLQIKENREDQKKQKETWLLGRERICDICIPFLTISRKHLQIFREEETCYVMDLSSKNGTKINGKRIPAMKKVKCTEKDILNTGGISFSLYIERSEPGLKILSAGSNKMLQALLKKEFSE